MRQLRPEQQAKAKQAQGTTAKHIAGDFLAEENASVKRVPQCGGGEHHRDQAAGDPLAGAEEADEVDAEQAQALGQADLVATAVHGLQPARKQQESKQDQPGQGEAVDDRHRDRDHA